MNGLKLVNFSCGYLGKPIIRSLSTPLLKRGQVIVLLGPNGCGKSTLLRALAGLNQRVDGNMYLDNADLLDKTAFDAYFLQKIPLLAPFLRHFSRLDRGKQVVYLPQSLPEGIHLTVLESINVALRATHCPLSAIERDKFISDLLIGLNIEHLALCYLNELSGGQRQLVGLAQSLIRQPQLLLLDEPLSALDLNYQLHVMNLVKKETKARNMITVVVVHDINIALKYADYVVILKKGQLVAAGKPTDAITSQNLAQVYGVDARVEYCSQGLPFLYVDNMTGDLDEREVDKHH